MRTVRQEAARWQAIGGAVAAAAVFGWAIYDGNWYGVAALSGIGSAIGLMLLHAWYRERY